jgi:ATP adenylyltransferase
MDRMWATWRMAYVGGKHGGGCVMCRIAAAGTDRQGWVVARSEHSIVALNAFPYNSGHVMILPRRHAASLSRLRRPERADLMECLERTERAIRRAYRPQGINMGVNLGRCAGAGVTGHVHIHVLPRWNGDTNFMPAISETKVLPESLPATWKRLRAAFREE